MFSIHLWLSLVIKNNQINQTLIECRYYNYELILFYYCIVTSWTPTRKKIQQQLSTYITRVRGQLICFYFFSIKLKPGIDDCCQIVCIVSKIVLSLLTDRDDKILIANSEGLMALKYIYYIGQMKLLFASYLSSRTWDLNFLSTITWFGLFI